MNSCVIGSDSPAAQPYTSGMRHVYLDLRLDETRDVSVARLVEIGAVEVVDGDLTERVFHAYLAPDYSSPLEATPAERNEETPSPADEQSFGEILQGFLDYVCGARLFMCSYRLRSAFLNAELARFGRPPIEQLTSGTYDATQMFRAMFPGEGCSLHVLGERLQVTTPSDERVTVCSATQLAMICSRIQSAAATSWPAFVGPAESKLKDLTHRIAASPSLPAGFGIAYIQRHAELGYHDAVEVMAQWGRDGLVDIVVDELGHATYHRLLNSQVLPGQSLAKGGTRIKKTG